MSLWFAILTTAGMAMFLTKSRRNYMSLPSLPAPTTTAPLDFASSQYSGRSEATVFPNRVQDSTLRSTG